jgi:hypothetical protein
MNNCHLLNVYKHGNKQDQYKEDEHNESCDLDDFNDNHYIKDYNYIYYQCYVDDENHFRYFETSPNRVTRHSKMVVYKISKNIPTFFHKTILYFKYIPKFF